MLDYILKPVTVSRVRKLLDKFERLEDTQPAGGRQQEAARDDEPVLKIAVTKNNRFFIIDPREAQDAADFQQILEAYRFRGYAKGVRGIHMRLLHTGVRIKILTLAPDAQDTYQAAEKIALLRQCGIEVLPSKACREHFAILDRCLVWYGSMNLLSNEKPDDNLIRLPDEQIAQELLEIAVQADSASENKTG